MERGNVERGNVERGNVERGNVERGNVERGNVERGNVERGPRVLLILYAVYGTLGRSLADKPEALQGHEAAQEVLREFERFLRPINAEAYKSLQQAAEDLLALQRLNVPSRLHRSLLSANAIENTFLNTRRKLGRVTRFRAESDQAARWLAYALLEAEKGKHRIRGYQDLPALVAALSDEQLATANPAQSTGPLSSSTAPATAKAPSS